MTILWVGFTLLAAFMQAWRNALQKQLRYHVSTLGATLARFIVALPMALIYVWLLYQYYPQAPLPTLSPMFMRFVVLAALTQIVATALMVRLFNRRNYAIGVGLAKSEAVIAAALGALFFATPLTYLAWMGVWIGGLAVWLLSNVKGQKLSFNSMLIGLASGLCFALCSLYIREAALLLRKDGINYLLAAAWVLVVVIAIQTIVLVVWLAWRERQTLGNLIKHGRLTAAVSVFGFLGSLGWFSAMSLQSVAVVKTLGQVEILFTLAISYFWFKETLNQCDYWGLGLIVLSAVLVI